MWKCKLKWSGKSGSRNLSRWFIDLLCKLLALKDYLDNKFNHGDLELQSPDCLWSESYWFIREFTFLKRKFPEIYAHFKSALFAVRTTFIGIQLIIPYIWPLDLINLQLTIKTNLIKKLRSAVTSLYFFRTCVEQG